jgi:ABC-type Mn2+/Zn2+ transport system ATPase subunit
MIENAVKYIVEQLPRYRQMLVGKLKLLFLDEPISGLHAQSSYNIIRFIRKLVYAVWPVLCYSSITNQSSK